MSEYDDYSNITDETIPSTMQAVIACGRRFDTLKVAEIPIPEINPNQLPARVDAAASIPVF